MTTRLGNTAVQNAKKATSKMTEATTLSGITRLTGDDFIKATTKTAVAKEPKKAVMTAGTKTTGGALTGTKTTGGALTGTKTTGGALTGTKTKTKPKAKTPARTRTS
jgi:hypothetical protein